MKSIKVCYIFVWCILFEIVYMCLSNYRNPIGGVICLILSYALIKKYKNCGKINIYIIFFYYVLNNDCLLKAYYYKWGIKRAISYKLYYKFFKQRDTFGFY